MKLLFYLIGILFLASSCTSSQSEERVISLNDYGKLIYPGTKYDPIDTLVFETPAGDRYGLKMGKHQKYPKQFKNFICFIVPDSVQFIDLITQREFSVPTDGSILATSAALEIDHLLLIVQFNEIQLIDVPRKKVIKSYDILDFNHLEYVSFTNALLDDSSFYFVIDHVFNGKERFAIYKTQLGVKRFRELTRFEERPYHLNSGNLFGWSGMKIIGDVIFLECENTVLAIDKRNGEIFDRFKTTESVFFDENNSQLKFTSGDKSVVFNIKSKKFR